MDQEIDRWIDAESKKMITFYENNEKLLHLKKKNQCWGRKRDEGIEV